MNRLNRSVEEVKMKRLNRSVARVIVGLLLAYSVACAKVPPTVTTPQGKVAWENIQVTKSLDLVRDLAIAATHSGVIVRSQGLLIVDWHSAAIRTLDARSQGWKASIVTGLDEALKELSPEQRKKFEPYVVLIGTVLAAL
jgi:hypothetical protein